MITPCLLKLLRFLYWQLCFDSPLTFEQNQAKMLNELKTLGRSLRSPDSEPAIAHILKLCRELLFRKIRPIKIERLENLIEASIARTLERLNIGNWKETPINQRQLVTILSFYQICVKLIISDDCIDDRLLGELFKIIDEALLFGAPLPAPNSDILQRCSQILQQKLPTSTQSEDSFRQTLINEEKYKNSIDNIPPINTEVNPPIEIFQDHYMKRRNPVILKECISTWPALKLWTSPKYLLNKIGHRIVPIELGSKYTDSEWTQKLMTVSEFMNEYILKRSTITGYLAQHQLFNQIPELSSDFHIPDYCALHESDSPDEVDVNAWFGPGGTISPLHTDPKHNLLAQVMGEKLIIVYPPEEGQNLYCHHGNLLQNTAQVDPLNPDYDKYPNFKYAQGFRHILKAGEILYIPPKWWHFVMSLSVSFSVSFWWN